MGGARTGWCSANGSLLATCGWYDFSMKSLVVILGTLLLLATSAQAASKYAGNYYAIATDDNPLHSGPKLAAGVNLTVHDDGSLTGRGAFIDFTPIDVTGRVKESGEVILVQTSAGHQITYNAQFAENGDEFTCYLPSGFYLVGEKIAADFPEAGVYHAKTEAGEEAIFFMRRDASVYGIVFNARGDLVDVAGEATRTGFNASAATGPSFDGQFHGTHINGGFDPEPILPLSLPFSGAKY
jgi:hypothetical protein